MSKAEMAPIKEAKVLIWPVTPTGWPKVRPMSMSRSEVKTDVCVGVVKEKIREGRVSLPEACFSSK